MNGKKALPLFVIASLMLSILPSFMFANAALTNVTLNTVDSDTHVYTALHTPYNVVKGDIVSVANVVGEGAISGATINVYWDTPSIAWNGAAGLLNSTTVKSSGAFDVWITIPDAKNGAHYLWLKDSSSGNVYGPFPTGGLTVNALVKLSPSRALPLDTVTVTLSGFLASNKTVVAFDGVEQVSPTTNSLGSATATFKVPDGTAYDDYAVTGTSTLPNGNPGPVTATATLTVGPVITASTTSSSVGTIVTINGRGFTNGYVIHQGDITLAGIACWITSPADADLPYTVTSTGRVRFSVVIPQTLDTDTYTLLVPDQSGDVTTDFEVTALASVSASPSFGPVASTIVVTGKNYPKISGTDVDITIGGVSVGTATTLADGTFTKSVKAPALLENTYPLVASAADYHIQDSVDFKIGTMNVILSDDSGATGTTISLSGNGFTAGEQWNATFGSDTIVENTAVGTGAGATLIAATFQVPQLPAGTYTITVWDKDTEISLTTQFKITATTTLVLAPTSAPNEYNVSVTGYGFIDTEPGAVDYVLYNKTSTGAVDYVVSLDVFDWNGGLRTSSVTNGTGFITSYWIVPTSDDLSVGNYFINATDASGDYMVTVPFTVGATHEVASPRSATFVIGDTVSFNFEDSFAPVNSQIKVYDPSGALYFVGDAIPSDAWVKSGAYYVLPYSAQTAGANPMSLPSDAPTGNWTWKWVDNSGDTIVSGTFAVAASPASTVDAEIAQLTTQITAVSNSVTQLSTTVSNVATSATAASNAATTASTAAAAAATAAQGAATTAGQAATAAQAALTAAQAAKTSADNAASAASGLTTLVYAAIGASLVAALAAIVALMQISRKIA